MDTVGKLRRQTVYPLTIDWDIDDFYSRPQKADTSLESPSFVFRESTWYLRLYPNGQRLNYSVENVGLYLLREESFVKQHHISFTLGIKCGDGTVYKSVKYISIFGSGSGFGASQIVERSELFRNRYKFAPTDMLTLFVEISLVQEPSANAYTQTTFLAGDEDSNVSRKEDIPYCTNEGADILIKNLKDLLLNEEDCDVTLKVENQELRAHRSILVARSPVFASMFRHNMSEKNSGEVNIPDCSPDAFKELLLYLYTGTVEHMSSDIVLDLYEAALKYDLGDLKKLCIRFMQGNISSDTFCEVITMSLKHNELELIKCATDFFVDNIIDILSTVKWQEFLKENPVPANELYIKAIKLGAALKNVNK